MRTNFLYKNILLVSITAAFALASCSNGQKKQTEANTDNEYNTSEQAYLNFVSIVPPEDMNNLNSNKSTEGNPAKDMFIGFNNVRLGTGINPVTNAIYPDTIPNSTEDFFYVDGNGKSYLPVNMTATSVSSTASITGSSSDQSDSSSLDTSTSFGANFGFVKIKAAAAFAKEHSSQDG
ncbi:MAG: hypothetical protein PHC75_10480, partial [Burkholderiales bacterium]|nr:hypothetical protein [Burkholderiales bacterium]